jgi:hypothetical protein
VNLCYLAGACWRRSGKPPGPVRLPRTGTGHLGRRDPGEDFCQTRLCVTLPPASNTDRVRLRQRGLRRLTDGLTRSPSGVSIVGLWPCPPGRPLGKATEDRGDAARSVPISVPACVGFREGAPLFLVCKRESSPVGPLPEEIARGGPSGDKASSGERCVGTRHVIPQRQSRNLNLWRPLKLALGRHLDEPRVTAMSPSVLRFPRPPAVVPGTPPRISVPRPRRTQQSSLCVE